MKYDRCTRLLMVTGNRLKNASS